MICQVIVAEFRAKPEDPFISTDETLASLSKKYNKSPVQVKYFTRKIL